MLETLGDLGTLWQALIATAVALPPVTSWLRRRRRIAAALQTVTEDESQAACEDATEHSMTVAAFPPQDQVDWLCEWSPSIDLLKLLGISEPYAESILDRWCRSETRPLVSLLGLDSDGRRVVLNLNKHGPSGLVVGPSGSGTSETLRTIVTYLAVSYPPDRVRIHLIDFKGGGVWRPISKFPHVSEPTSLALGPLNHHEEPSRVTNLVTRLDALLAEKMRLIEAAGCSDIGEFNHCVSHDKRLAADIVLVDELILAYDQSGKGLHEHLLRFAARGRSLGFSLILGQGRPGSDLLYGIDCASLRFRILHGDCDAQPWLPSHVSGVYRRLPSHVERGKGVLVLSGHDTKLFQSAIVGSFEREHRDSPFHVNRTIDALAEGASRAAEIWQAGPDF